MTRFEKMKTMTIDEIVDYVFAKTNCEFCIRRNYGSCHDLVGGCKKYIKDFFEEEIKDDKGNARTMAAEAMSNSLKVAGYDAGMYYQVD